MTNPIIRPTMTRCALHLCLATSCLLLSSVHALDPIQRHYQPLRDGTPSQRQRRASRLVGLRQDFDDIDVDSLEQLWDNEAVKAQAEAERLLLGNDWAMSMVPTRAPATVPPALSPTPVTTPTTGTSAPSSASGCNGLSRPDFLLSKLSPITPEATLQDPATPQGQAFSFMNINDPLTADICTYPTVEIRYALITLYFSTNGAQWVNNTGWMTGLSECEWYGITCNDGVFTSNITLPLNNLEGSLPNEIGAISTLTRLELFSNEVAGPIPPGISNLTQLEVLDLEENRFNGTLITPELLQLTGLVNLFLSNNEFSGSIPSEINQLSQLESFWAAGNKLVGSVPDSLGDVTTISTLILYNNLLDNSLDAAPFPRLVNLQNLQLWGNNFQGSITADYSSLSQLSVLRLDFNIITGTLPTEIGTLTSLVDLRLSNNLMSGTLPSELASLNQLEYLVLGTSFWSGPIPDIFGSMPGLNTLDLSFSSFTGTIPASIFNSSAINMVYLNNNGLTGTIPASYANAASLTELFLNNNLLTGTIPPASPELSSLTDFTLQFNSLTGVMPPSVCDLRDPTVGNLTALLSDCQGASPEVECDFPDCCTRCYDNSMNPAGTRRRRQLAEIMAWHDAAAASVR